MTVLLYLIFFAVLLGVGAWVAAFVRRRVAPENQRRATIAVWLAILVIPFWDVIPVKVYFYYQCRTAGVEILDKSYPKEAYYAAWAGENARAHTTLPFGVEKWEDTYPHPETGKPLFLYRSYGTHIGWDAFWKPWLASYCPGPVDQAERIKVKHNLIKQKIEELQK